MIIITGGAYQGKKDYVEKTYNISKCQMLNGKECSTEDLIQTKCVYNFHFFIKRDSDIFNTAKRLVSENPDIIIITDEIGSGIIPLDKNERIWRENTGKICCYLVRYAETVVRLNCGLPLILKNVGKEIKK